MPLSDGADMAYLRNTQFKLTLDKFECLGVVVTRKLAQLLKQNWDKKVNQLEKNIELWSTLPISLVGPINAIKMVVLPRFLYIFQSIPVCIPQLYFKKLKLYYFLFCLVRQGPQNLQKTSD